MSRQALADRLVSYSDTLVAFSLVNGLAFVITLGEPDIRCSIAAVSGVLFGVNLAIPLIGSYALFWLRDYRNSLLDAVEASESEVAAESATDLPPSIRDEDVERFWRIAFWIRLGLVWFFAAVVVTGVLGATQDTRCLGELG